MLDSSSIVRLYTNVLFNDMSHYGIADEYIRIGIKSMTEVYKPSSAKQTALRSTVADFNDVAHRCAYLHKYAALHTTMVRDMMYAAVRDNFGFFQRLVYSEECFKICSLGGGPGSDIIGVLAALHLIFPNFEASVSVLDYMVNWSYSFHSILKELTSGSYGPLGHYISNFLQWRYVGANLLKSLTPEVELEISSASLVTMIKFVSAASCKDTEFMVKNIFTAMKPGAVLFFIDNDGGGFRELILEAALEYNFISVFGPIRHEHYSNDMVRVERFGSVSCHKTVVSVHILQKPPIYQPYVCIPNTYCNPCPEYPERRVLLDSPLRYGDPATYDNLSFAGTTTPLPYEMRFSREENLNNQFYRPHQISPLTPCVFQHNSGALIGTPVRRNAIYPPPYSFVGTPVRSDIINTSNPENRRRQIFSPETPQSGKRRCRPKKNGCLPLSKFKHWRHHLSRKLSSFKHNTFASFKKAGKPNRTSKK